MLAKGIFSFFGDLLFLAFPSFCPVTGRLLVGSEHLISQQGFAELPLVSTGPHNQCEEIKKRLLGRLPVNAAWAYLNFRKYSASRRIMHEFKYRGKSEMGTLLASRHALMIKEQLTDRIDAIVPVPMHPHKQKKRGYNQSAILARAIGDITQLPVYEDVLLKTLNTGSLTRLGRWNRFVTSESVYQVNPEHIETIAGKRVLLVDDVMTTGATLEICGNLLLNAGAGSISIYALMVSEK